MRRGPQPIAVMQDAKVRMQKRRSHVFIGYGRFCISFRIWNFAFCITDLLLDRVALNVGPVAVQCAGQIQLGVDIRDPPRAPAAAPLAGGASTQGRDGWHRGKRAEQPHAPEPAQLRFGRFGGCRRAGPVMRGVRLLGVCGDCSTDRPSGRNLGGALVSKPGSSTSLKGATRATLRCAGQPMLCHRLPVQTRLST